MYTIISVCNRNSNPFSLGNDCSRFLKKKDWSFDSYSIRYNRGVIEDPKPYYISDDFVLETMISGIRNIVHLSTAMELQLDALLCLNDRIESIQHHCLPTAHDIQSFESRKFWVSKKILSHSQIRIARSCLKRENAYAYYPSEDAYLAFIAGKDILWNIVCELCYQRNLRFVRPPCNCI